MHHQQQENMAASRYNSKVNNSPNNSSFWTACPYCYVLYEYPWAYSDCCLRCQNCERAFHAASVPQLPALVPGKDAYYCCWGYFPLGFSMPGNGPGFPNWMPPVFSQPETQAQDKEDNVTAA